MAGRRYSRCNAASTFLTHYFGSGLVEDTYVVEKFTALVNGDIRRCPDAAPAKGRRKTKYVTATLKAVTRIGAIGSKARSPGASCDRPRRVRVLERL